MSQLPQTRNPSEMDSVEDLKRKLYQLEQKNLLLTQQHNQELFHYENEVRNLRLELERGEALRRGLESEISFARKEAHMQMYTAEDQLYDVKVKLLERQVLNDKHQQKAAETEEMFQNAQSQWEEEQQRFTMERDNIRREHLAEIEFLINEKNKTEMAHQETNAALQNMRRKLKDMEIEHIRHTEMLRLQAIHLDFKDKRQKRLMGELKAATEQIKKLEENAEAARLAHMECMHTTEIMQLRIQELEHALSEDQGGRREAFSVVVKTDFKGPENAQASGKVLQEQHSSSNVQRREGAEERKETEEASGRLVNAASGFGLQEGPVRELSILLDLYQRMVDSHVVAKQPDVPLEALPWTDFFVLLHENVAILIADFHKAKETIAHLEYISKHKTDTMNDLQQNQEDAFEKMSEQLKAQEHCWQKEKQYLEQQYSNLLAEVHRRAQACEETAQKNRQKLYDLEQICEKLAHENNSVRNTLSDAYKARSSLLAACALLSGALCPLYVRLCAMSSQRDLLQYQMDLHELVNQKIRSLLYVLPTYVENNQDEARLRQRRVRHLIYVFRRAVIAVLATNRLRALARNSCSLFIWTDGSRGSAGIQVCVGESKGWHHVSTFEEEGVDSIEALDWLTSCNLYNAIISSVSELQEVLSKPDPRSWLSGRSLVSAARNSFANLMDNLSVLMEQVQGNPCGCRADLERDSLIQRLACGLQRLNAQAVEAGFYDRLTSTRNIAILQQEVFTLSRVLHMTEVECRSLRLQLAEFKWTFNEMQKDAEKAHGLQEQLSALQHKIITQDNINEELDNALQREREAKLLLQEYERRLQDLNNRLELHSGADAHRGQDPNVAPMSLSNAMEELRRRDDVLNHQEILLKDMEQDRQLLREALQEAELALQQAAKDKELIINHMKAVDATLNAVMDQAVASGPTVATLLPSLQLETLSEEATRDRPEAIAFQHVLMHFMDLYSLAAARVETLITGGQPLQVHFEPAAAGIPPAPAPAPHESLHVHFEPEAGGTPPAPAPAPSPAPSPGESLRVHFGSEAAGAPPAPAATPADSFWRPVFPKTPRRSPAPARLFPPDESLRLLFEPTAAGAPPAPTPAPAPAQHESLRLLFEPAAAGAPPAPIPTPAPAQHDSFWLRVVPQTPRLSSAPAPAPSVSFWSPVLPQTPRPPPAQHESFWGRVGVQLDKTAPAHAQESDEPFQPQFVPKGAAAPHGPEIPDIFQVIVQPREPRTPPTPVPAPEDIFQPHVSLQAARTPPAPVPAPEDIFQPRVSPQAPSTPPAPVPAPEASESESLNQFPCESQLQLDLSNSLDFLALNSDQSYGAIHHGPFAMPGTEVPSGVTLSKSYTAPGTKAPSRVIMSRSYTAPGTKVPSGVKLSRSYTAPGTVVPSGVVPGRPYSVSEINIPSSVPPDRAGFGSLTDLTFYETPSRIYSVSEPSIPSSVAPDRRGFGSSADISCHPMDETSIASGMSPIRPGMDSATDIFMNLAPTGNDTGLSMDASTHMTQNRISTVPSTNTPSSQTGNGTGTGSSVNTSFSSRPGRTISSPSVGSVSQDQNLSPSTRSNQ